MMRLDEDADSYIHRALKESGRRVTWVKVIIVVFVVVVVVVVGLWNYQGHQG